MEFFTLIIIVVAILAAGTIVNLIKEIFEFFIKLAIRVVMAGALVFFIFIVYNMPIESRESFGVWEKPNAVSPMQEKKEVDPLNSTTKDAQDLGRLSVLMKDNVPHKKINPIKVESPERTLKYFNQPKTVFTRSKANGHRDIYTEKESVVEDKCEARNIPHNYFVIVEGVYSSDINASRRVEELKGLGFRRASFFISSCYSSKISDNYFVVMIDRPCRSEASIRHKKDNAMKKIHQISLNNEQLRVVQVQHP